MISQPYTEEADLQIIVHVLDSIKSGCYINVVLSNDVDVAVGLLFYMSVFMQHGSKEIWFRGGKGDTTRFVPLHTLYETLGENICSVLPALHSLTGCDITSKVGTKKAALKANPERYLANFGRYSPMSEGDSKLAEEFLVNVLKSTSKCKDFMELRSEIFNFSKTSSLLNLPPTSYALLPHIERAFYNTYCMTHILDDSLVPLNPELFGFKMDNSSLLPEKRLKEINESWTVICKCSNCSRITCPCRALSVNCVRFCSCKKKDDCKNPF